MKKVFEILGITLGLTVLFILTILIGEWVYSEIQFQIWLSQDPRRFDFSGYDTAEELREALLTKLPLGSSETEVQAFKIANGYTYRKPGKGASGRFGVVIQEAQGSSRGLFGFRVFFGGMWIIFFELDRQDHSLVDISVKWHPGP
ncbi:hypothetical protein ACFLXQ_07630 [Chloroflexota bacterium]